MGEVVVTGILTFFLLAGICQGFSFLYDLWYFRKETHREEEEGGCDCPTPSKYTPFGSTFVCPECARKWYSTHDNIAWAGWSWAPLWKRIQIRLGWDRRKYEDPKPHSPLAHKLEKEYIDTALGWVRGARARERTKR